MNPSFRPTFFLGASLVLALGANGAFADPHQDAGKGGKPMAQHGQPMNHGQPGRSEGQHGQPEGHKGHKGAHGQADGRDSRNAQQGHSGHAASHGSHDGRASVSIDIRGPQVNVPDVRGILIGHRHLLAPVDNLPPGIRMNVARGKALPPGIAKNIDPRLIGRLPRYEGYEWKQVGRDIILVAVTTGIVYLILDQVLN